MTARTIKVLLTEAQHKALASAEPRCKHGIELSALCAYADTCANKHQFTTTDDEREGMATAIDVAQPQIQAPLGEGLEKAPATEDERGVCDEWISGRAIPGPCGRRVKERGLCGVHLAVYDRIERGREARRKAGSKLDPEPEATYHAPATEDEREGLLYLLTNLPAGATDEGQEIPLLHMLPESAREYLRDAILAAGHRKRPDVTVDERALTLLASEFWNKHYDLHRGVVRIGVPQLKEFATAVLALINGEGK